MQRLVTSKVFLALLIATCTACTTSPDTIRVGVLADQTGPYANTLRGIPRGVELAVDAFERQHDVTVETFIGDQQSCKKKHTTTIMQRFTHVNDVDFIIGGTCSSTTIAAAPIAQTTRTPLISPSSSAPSISHKGEYVFRTYINDAQRAHVAADIVESKNVSHIAVFVDGTNDAATQIADAFTDVVNANTTTIRTQRDTDFRTEALKARNADAVMLTYTGSEHILELLTVLRRNNEYELIISPFETVAEPAIRDATVAHGVTYIKPGTPDNRAYATLQRRYRRQYNESLPSYTAEAYDATTLGLRAAVQSDTPKQFIQRLHEVSKNYDGASGNVTFDANGDVHKELAVKQITNGRIVDY